MDDLDDMPDGTPQEPDELLRRAGVDCQFKLNNDGTLRSRPFHRLPVAEKPTRPKRAIHLASEHAGVLTRPSGHQSHSGLDVFVALHRPEHNLRQLLLAQRLDQLVDRL